MENKELDHCPGTKVVIGNRDGVFVGLCEGCNQVVTRLNAYTGVEEWLDHFPVDTTEPLSPTGRTTEKILPTRYSELGVEELKNAVRHIAVTADSDQEIRDRMKKELGYPYRPFIYYLERSRARIIVKFFAPNGEFLEI